jgi:hypothetical protein
MELTLFFGTRELLLPKFAPALHQHHAPIAVPQSASHHALSSTQVFKRWDFDHNLQLMSVAVSLSLSPAVSIVF